MRTFKEDTKNTSSLWCARLNASACATAKQKLT